MLSLGRRAGPVCLEKAAVQFVRANAGELRLDPDRVGLIGDSPGAYLAAMVALAGEEPLFAEHDQDPQAAVSCKVKTVVGFYGAYDMLAQWEHDQISRPRDQFTEKFLGVPPMISRKTFFEASSLSFVTLIPVIRGNPHFVAILNFSGPGPPRSAALSRIEPVVFVHAKSHQRSGKAGAVSAVSGTALSVAPNAIASCCRR